METLHGKLNIVRMGDRIDRTKVSVYLSYNLENYSFPIVVVVVVIRKLMNLLNVLKNQKINVN